MSELEREGKRLSNSWGYVCRSHDPEIESDHWFNRGAALLAEVYQKVQAGEWPDCTDPLLFGEPEGAVAPSGVYATREPIYWLRQHPRCDVALRSEYGDTREIAEPRTVLVSEDYEDDLTGRALYDDPENDPGWS